MATEQLKVPDIGGAEGAEVIEVLVAVGDEIGKDQSLIVLESDKASMEIPASAAGKVVELLTEVGKTLSEGDPIVVVELAGEASPQATVEEDPHASAQDTAETAPEPQPEPATKPEPAEPELLEEAPAPVAEQLVTVPDIGTEDAVDLIEVSVAVGDEVAEGDSLVVLESDKASMEVPAPSAGVVREIRVAEGDTVKQGDALLVLAGAVPAAKPQAASTEAPSPEQPAPAPESKSAAQAVAAPPSAAAPAAGGASASAYAGPAVRRLAREFGLDLAVISGSGPRGRVLKEDLQDFVKHSLKDGAGSSAGLPKVPEVDFSAFGPVEVEPLTKMGKVTAANMQRSWLNVPHVTQFDDADITDLEAFRTQMKSEAEQRGVKLTPMPFLLKACAVALRDHPRFRSSLTADGESLVTKQYIHIGMAVDTPAGLLVPVIRDVDRKTIWELAAEVVAMATRARDRKLMPVDMQGGCFTISSLGGIGGKGFTPIVNTPEVGILGVSKATMQPVWNGQEFEPRKMLPLSLSYDHRVVNGGDGGRFFAQVVSLLSDIRRLSL